MEYKKAAELFNSIKLNLTDVQFKSFEKYKEDLLYWNTKINLTAITEDEEIWIKHFLDSATILKYIQKNSSLIDIGTGAGFPSIPVNIMDNSIKITLLDSLNKRINFLKTTCENLGINNAEFVHGRAEDFANDNNYREKFDIATARAVANLSTLVEYCLPFVKKGGIFICMKGDNCETEIKEAKVAIKKLGGKISKIDSFEIAAGLKRNIIIIEKVSNTPKEYPRKAGTPSKNPIK